MALAQEILSNAILPSEVISSHFVSLKWLFHFPNTGFHISTEYHMFIWEIFCLYLFNTERSFVPFWQRKGMRETHLPYDFEFCTQK